jgi:hypothetical protein
VIHRRPFFERTYAYWYPRRAVVTVALIVVLLVIAVLGLLSPLVFTW